VELLLGVLVVGVVLGSPLSGGVVTVVVVLGGGVFGTLVSEVDGLWLAEVVLCEDEAVVWW
jgi:hypothetical protein